MKGTDYDYSKYLFFNTLFFWVRNGGIFREYFKIFCKIFEYSVRNVYISNKIVIEKLF